MADIARPALAEVLAAITTRPVGHWRAEVASPAFVAVERISPRGGLDVMAYRYRRDGAAVDLGACVWCGRVREGRWSGVIGEPRASVLASAWRWCQESALRSAAIPR